MKKLYKITTSVFLMITLLMTNLSLTYAKGDISTIRTKKDIDFIKKYYNMTEDQALNLPDITFETLRKEKPSDKTKKVQHFSLKEKKINSLPPEFKINNDINSSDICLEETTSTEFESAKNNHVLQNHIKSDYDDDIYKDFGWVRMETYIFYLSDSDRFFLANNISYVQTAYVTISPIIDFFTGLGVSHNLSILNKSAYFNWRATQYATINGFLITNEIDEVKQYADKTNGSEYGFKFTTYSNCTYIFKSAYASVLAIPNSSDTTFVDCYGHFSVTKDSINLSASVGIDALSISISPSSKTTYINPIHVQCERKL